MRLHILCQNTCRQGCPAPSFPPSAGPKSRVSRHLAQHCRAAGLRANHGAIPPNRPQAPAWPAPPCCARWSWTQRMATPLSSQPSTPPAPAAPTATRTACALCGLLTHGTRCASWTRRAGRSRQVEREKGRVGGAAVGMFFSGCAVLTLRLLVVVCDLQSKACSLPPSTHPTTPTTPPCLAGHPPRLLEPHPVPPLPPCRPGTSRALCAGSQCLLRGRAPLLRMTACFCQR